MNKNVNNHIGGEFEFDESLFNKKDNLFTKNCGSFYVNGRSALKAIINDLIEKNIKLVYVPAYNCSSIIQVIKSLNISYRFYAIDKNFKPLIKPKENSAIIINHYFGWKNQFKKENNIHIIEDATHVYLNKDYNILKSKNYIFISLRKHTPLAFGGWSNIRSKNMKETKEISILAEEFISFRKKKFIQILNKSYYKNEIYFLDKLEYYEKKISKIYDNERIPEIIKEHLIKYDWNKISERRRKNWNYLDNLIGKKVNKVFSRLERCTVPLGYVIRSEKRNLLRNNLLKERIFTSIHWKLNKELNEKNFLFETTLSKEILTIPIDHRYNFYDMKVIANKISKYI